MNESMKNLMVKSPLDIDFYKLTMGYFVWKYFPNEIVKYKFKNRTKNINLSHLDKQVKYELDSIRSQYKYTEDELAYVANLKITGTDKSVFPEDYVRFLSTVQLPPINVFTEDKELQIETEGAWKYSILWETMALSTVNGICYNGVASLEAKDYKTIGEANLRAKIEKIKLNPSLKFTEFGTRRRFSYEWQKHVLEILKNEVPNNLMGTSNVLLAKELGLTPVGTMAHELFMIGSRLFGDSDEEIYSSHGKILDMWFDLLGKEFSIALTDTFGSEFFFNDFGKERAEKWRGMRQDSGEPEIFALQQLDFYTKNNIKTQEKLFVPSDGLNVDKIISLQNQFKVWIQMSAGWGTDLTNDVGFKPLSIVMKAVSVNGLGTVKLSDNIAKATGLQEDIERFKRIFKYSNTQSQEIVF